MKTIGRWIPVGLVAGLLLSACGEKPCTSLCQEIKPKLIDQLPDISEDEVRCSAAPWTEADTCDECLEVLAELYDVSVTDSGELCDRHF